MSTDGHDTPSGRDRNAELSRMVRLLSQVGPNINDIAAKLDVFKETARYWYNKALLHRGFSIKAVPNYKKLGLDRLILIAGFAPPFRSHAKTIFAFLHERCYVKEVEQTAFEGQYLVHVAVPTELAELCADLFRQLEGMGVFSHLETHRFGWVRTPPMMSDYFDFRKAAWDYDWPPQQKAPLVPVAHSPREKYDKVDIVILRELQDDSNRSLWQISKRTGIGYRNLIWHQKYHVRPRGLIGGYSLDWRAVELNGGDGRARSYLPMKVLLTDASEAKRVSVTTLIQRLPFLWFEASGSEYFASLYFPPDVVEEFVSRVADLGLEEPEIRYFLTKKGSAEDYGVSYHLFDGPTKKWQLDKPDVIRQFEKLVVQVNK